MRNMNLMGEEKHAMGKQSDHANHSLKRPTTSDPTQWRILLAGTEPGLAYRARSTSLP